MEDLILEKKKKSTLKKKQPEKMVTDKNKREYRCFTRHEHVGD